jgi:NAD(P)H-flavin reductase/ferredoxin
VGKSCRVTINGQVFLASRGDVLLDAALMSGIDVPHDCRSGHCGTCRVRVVDGLTIGGEYAEPGAVRACQSRIVSDLRLEIETLPEIATTTGRVTAIEQRAPDVVEICIEPAQPFLYLPGQYVRVQFRGYPARCYSPTVSMDDFTQRDFLHFQVRRVRGGRVSAAIGRGIRAGHRVTIEGPLGTAFLRPASKKRLVLVAGGTGFAPIWSIATAAVQEYRHRRIDVVVGARTVKSLYMMDALCILARCPSVTIMPVVEAPQNLSTVIRTGNVIDYVPALCADDTVHTCGSPRLVDAVSRLAAIAGVPCYSDPFVPQRAGALFRALDWINGVQRNRPAAGKAVRRGSPQPRFMDPSAFAEHAV